MHEHGPVQSRRGLSGFDSQTGPEHQPHVNFVQRQPLVRRFRCELEKAARNTRITRAGPTTHVPCASYCRYGGRDDLFLAGHSVCPEGVRPGAWLHGHGGIDTGARARLQHCGLQRGRRRAVASAPVRAIRPRRADRPGVRPRWRDSRPSRVAHLRDRHPRRLRSVARLHDDARWPRDFWVPSDHARRSARAPAAARVEHLAADPLDARHGATPGAAVR